jgi:molybdenum cofactor biosynthesis enzyme MoaA
VSTLTDIILGLRAGKTSHLTPNYLEVSLVGSCNFACVQCHQLHHITAEQQRDPRAGPKQLQFDKLLSILEQAKALGVETIEFCGRGEPSLFKELPTVIRRTKALGFRSALMTNGSNVSDELLAALRESAYDEVAISLYGLDEESFASIAQPRKSQSLAQIFSNVDRLLEDAPQTRLTVTLLLQKPWLRRLELLHDLFGKYPKVNFELVVVHPYLDKSVDSGFDRSAFARELSFEYDELARRQGEDMMHPSLRRFVEKIRTNPETNTILTTYRRVPCYAGHWAMFLCDDGTIRPCSNSSWIMGSAYELTLKQIWKGAEYDSFRATARNHMIETGTPIRDSYCDSCGWAWLQQRLHNSVQDSSLPSTGFAF